MSNKQHTLRNRVLDKTRALNHAIEMAHKAGIELSFTIRTEDKERPFRIYLRAEKEE